MAATVDLWDRTHPANALVAERPPAAEIAVEVEAVGPRGWGAVPWPTIVGTVGVVQLLGIVGALLAVPVAAAIQIVAQDLWKHRRPTSGRAVPEPAPSASAASRGASA